MFSNLVSEPAQSLLAQVFESSSLPMLITDLEGRICAANAALERVSGFSSSELLGQRPSLMRSSLQPDTDYQELWKSLREQQSWQGEIWNRRKDGRVFREWLAISLLRDAQGRPSHYLGQYAGLGQDPRQPQGAAPGSADIDRNTGLLVREAFFAAADHLGRRGEQMAVLTLDIERFTDLNEQFGLEAGDLLLRLVALRCTQVAASCGGRQLIGRVGADEFAIAWVPTDPAAPCTPAAAQALAQRFHDGVCGRYELGLGQPVEISVQTGVALATVGQHQAAEALLLASAARHDAALGAAVRHYEAHDSRLLQTRALRAAIEQRQIAIALQPKVDLRSGALRGVEALARWTAADGEPVPPACFIPLAEREGLIAALGDRVLEQALDWAAWARDSGRPVRVAVNCSAAQFHRPGLVAEVQQQLRRQDLAPQSLELELTESILLDDAESALEALAMLRELGLGLAIDDFGTGYSSLSYLCRFPVDHLKLDRSFIARIGSDGRRRALVRSLIALAHQLGLRCVAEGIETIEQLELLRQYGCDEGQGYLLARPMSPLAAFEMLHGEAPWMHLFETTAQEA